MFRYSLPFGFAVIMFLTGWTHRQIVELQAPEFENENVLTGLQMPWDIAFLPNGKMLYTERCTGLSILNKDGSSTRLFGIKGSALEATDLVCEGQSGIGGIAVDPEFETNRFIYVYMSSNMTVSPRSNHVIRLVLNAEESTVSDRKDIVTDIRYKDKENSWGKPGSHSGSRLRFGPDGYLYITTGDNHNGPLPQDLTALGGKVLRVDREGIAAADNNPPPTADKRIFTYGHRNVQGLAFKPGSGAVFVAEHGPNHSDEVTVLENGGNGGWDPVPEAGVICADNYCGYISNKVSGELTPMTDLEKFPNALKPAWVLEDSQGMGPAEFVNGNQWKDWNGALLVGVMAAKSIQIVHFDENNQFISATKMNLPEARYRSIVSGPDGSIYVATDEGFIQKLSPK